MLIMSNGYHFNHIALFYMMQSFNRELDHWERAEAWQTSQTYAIHC